MSTNAMEAGSQAKCHRCGYPIDTIPEWRIGINCPECGAVNDPFDEKRAPLGSDVRLPWWWVLRRLVQAGIVGAPFLVLEVELRQGIPFVSGLFTLAIAVFAGLETAERVTARRTPSLSRGFVQLVITLFVFGSNVGVATGLTYGGMEAVQGVRDWVDS